MEQNPHSGAVNTPDAAAMDSPPQSLKPTPRRRHGKSRGPMNVIKVALLMMRRRSSKSNTLPVNEGSRSIWRKLVGSMRPLHLQSNQLSPPSLQPEPPLPLIKVAPPSENTDDALSYASESPAASSHYHSVSSSSSRYASTVALNELDQPEEEPQEEGVKEEEGEDDDDDDDEDYYRDMEGDAMIDAKAEEFIARFYHQMRLQLSADMDRRHRARSLRSLR